MATDKRRRELARAKAERQAQRRAQRAQRARRNKLIGALAAAAVIVAVIAWAAWPQSEVTPAADEATPSVAATESASPEATPANTPGPVATPAGVSCEEPGAPRTDGRTWQRPEPQNLPDATTWVLNTNCGAITIGLDAAAAPENANGLAFLTEQGYYTGNFCHRLTTAGIFVLQCGAPGADGTGDVGFSLPDENLPDEGEGNYPAGTVAMANRGADTASSQFFLVYKDSTLPPGYTVVGDITKGLDIVKYVAAAGVQAGSSDATDGPPAQPLLIKTAQIEK